METSVTAFMRLYQLSSGRIRWALLGIAEALAERDDEGLAPIAQHVQAAREHADELVRLEHDFAVGRAQGRGNPEAVAIDVKLDRAIVLLHVRIRSYVDPYADEHDEPTALARALLLAWFPNGVREIIQQPFVEQLITVETLLDMTEREHPRAIEVLSLRPALDRIAELNEDYRRALNVDRPEHADFADVQAARATAQRMLMQVVAMILGRFPLDTDEHADAREALLRPVARQNEAVREEIRVRRRRGRRDAAA